MDSIPYIDELIKEYLLFRGYIKTYTALNTEKHHDKTNNPEVEPIVEALLNHIKRLELVEFIDLWNTIESRFFTHLPSTFVSTIRYEKQAFTIPVAALPILCGCYAHGCAPLFALL